MRTARNAIHDVGERLALIGAGILRLILAGIAARAQAVDGARTPPAHP